MMDCYILPWANLFQADIQFVPIHSVCNPCLLNFTCLGELETFEDTEYVNKTDYYRVKVKGYGKSLKRMMHLV